MGFNSGFKGLIKYVFTSSENVIFSKYLEVCMNSLLDSTHIAYRSRSNRENCIGLESSGDIEEEVGRRERGEGQ